MQKTSKLAEILSNVALFVTITIVLLVINAGGTDLHFIQVVGIALGFGLVAALTTYLTVNWATRSREPQAPPH